MLDMSKLKEFTDDKLKVGQIVSFLIIIDENIIQKGEKCWLPGRKIGGHIVLPLSVCPSVCLSAQT